MQIRLLLVLGWLWGFSVNAQKTPANRMPAQESKVNLVPVKMTKHILVNLPDYFKRLSDDEAKSRFRGTAKMVACYGVKNQPLDFSFTIAKPLFEEKDINILKKLYKVNIRSLYNKVVFLSEGTRKVSGKNAAWFEFISTVSEKNKGSVTRYTYIQYVIHRKRVLTFTLTAPSKDDSEWEEPAKEIMSTIQVNL